MKYIELSDNCKRVYEVEMDKKRIKELITLLDRDCYVRKFGICYTVSNSYSKDEAAEVIRKMVNHANLNINEYFEVKKIYEGDYWSPGQPLDVNYEAIYKDSVLLINYLESLLDNPTGDCTKIINNIINYNQSIDFTPFTVRVRLAEETFDRQQDDGQGIKLLKMYENAIAEAKLNENYNFDRLYELYQEVLKCFSKTLVEETFKYESGKDAGYTIDNNDARKIDYVNQIINDENYPIDQLPADFQKLILSERSKKIQR